MENKNYFFSGITELLILAILADHDSYVYEIVKFIKEYSKGYLSISQNTEYSKLVGKRRTRIFYHIEPNGNSYYKQLLDSFRDAYHGVENILQALSRERGSESNE